MNMNTAYSLVGDQPVYAIRNMVKALHMCEWLNTESDLQRRIAGQFILRNGKAYRSHCAVMRAANAYERRRKQSAA
jgi:hypothetical protein